MEDSTEGGRLIPEQVWDTQDLPERELFVGKPSGSACPLVWAHAEYIKLRRSLRDGVVFDQAPQPVQRYQVEKKTSPYFGWRCNNKPRSMPCGKILRVVLRAPALVHWSVDDWHTSHDTATRDSGLHMHYADLPTEKLTVGQKVIFTLRWIEEDRWEGTNYTVTVE